MRYFITIPQACHRSIMLHPLTSCDCRSSQPRSTSRWRASQLEQRIMLAADAGAVVVSQPIPGSTDSSLGVTETTQRDSAGQLVFIDSSVESIDELAQSAMENAEIILLSPDQDGITQITNELSARRNVSTIHLVSHGESGRMRLGNAVVDLGTLKDSSEQLRAWASSLREKADILVYGCETGKGTAGREFTSALAFYTRADVASSTNATGNESDWVLERQVGSIESAIVFDPNSLKHYAHSLPITITAAGVENSEQMQLLIDGSVVQTWDNVGGDAYAGVFETFTHDADGISADRVRVSFTNDLFDEVNGFDRNLRIDKITIDGVDYQTEDPSVFSTGTYLPADGVQPGFRENEFLHTDGYFQYAVGTPTGTLIEINASGFTGEESMTLQIDGVEVESWGSVSSSANTYVYQASELVTPDRIRVAFTNDLFDEANGIDRNLTVDNIRVDGVTIESESIGVFSTGSWLPEDGIVHGFGRSEILNANGYFQYGQVSLDPNPEPGTVVIFAAGTTGDENIELSIGSSVAASFSAIGGDPDARSFRQLVYQGSGPITVDQVRIAFTNDLFDEANAIDRNVVIDKIAIDGVEYETEGPDVFSTGTWLPADDVTPGFRQSETLHTNGYFQFGAQPINAGFVGLGATQVTVNEVDATVEIPITRYDGSDGPATVFYQTVGVTAEDGQDFVGTTSGRVDFVDGQTTSTAIIDLIDDGDTEAIETFSVSLFRAEGAELGVPRTAIVTIVDDETGTDLAGRWRLDESTINQAVIDSSQNGNDGVFANFDSASGPRTDAPDVTSPNLGSVFFDGVNDYVSIAPDSSLDLSGGSFTQSVWIKPTGTSSGYQGVLGFQPTSGTVNRYPGIWVYQGDRIHAGFGDGTNWNSFNTASVLTPGVWNHVATTFDGTTYRAFANGTQVFSTDDFAGRTPTATQRVDIGRVDNYFTGDIDDVQIYNRALSPSEISVLIDGANVPDIPVDGQFTTNQLYSGFDTPIAVDWLPNGTMLVAEQDGRVIAIAPDGTRQSSPLLDITDRVNSGTKDRGMLGFAVHPDFANNPYIYVSYTYDPPEVYGNSGLGGPDGNGARVARISRFTVNAAGTLAASNTEFVLVGNNSTYDNIGSPNIRPGLNDLHSCFDENGNPLEDCIPADETSHTIGDLEFGPDGMLYASSGDGGSFGRVDPVNLRALDLDSLAGKVLRIDPITGEGPSDNPFFDGNAESNQSKVYQYGLRNPFRLAVNQDTGDVFSGDVGWTQWEEINVGRGANFGWPAFEGGSDGSLQTQRYRDLAEVQAYYATNPDVTAPAWARLHSDGARAIIMGDFVSGSAYPTQYQDALLFTDIGDQVLRAATFDASGAISDVSIVSAGVGFIVDIQRGADGYLYYVDITGNVGRLEFDIA